jgi:hypothetical protein
VSTEALANQTAGSSGMSNEILPVDPFRSLYVHFGMLLGVDDFQTLDAYHRGKMWYHSAWLHGTGVVWGLAVNLPTKTAQNEEQILTGEIRVEAGLAIDGLGRELLLEHAACLNLAAWYEAHQDDTALIDAITTDEETGDIIFDGHITLEFRSCLTRQVPALSETCDNSSTSTAYSRVVETVKVCMHPGLAQPKPNTDYHRLKLLFGLVEARLDDEGIILDSDADVLAARAQIMAANETQRPALCQQWFSQFAVLDGIDVQPNSPAGTSNFSGFPRPLTGEVVLANIQGLRLHKVDDQWVLIDGQVDVSVRPYLLPTNTIQSLLCHTCKGEQTSSGEVSSPPISGDAGGPRIAAQSVQMQGTEKIIMTISGSPLMKASVEERGISVTAFDTRDGWVPCKIKHVKYKAGDNQIEIELRDAPAGVLVRLIVKGTGDTPILGRNRIPLAGSVDSPAGSIHQGNDFVHMFKTRSGS